MPRRERELIRRQYARPAMRFQMARTLPVADFLQPLEHNYSSKGRGGCDANGCKAIRSACDQENEGQAVPQPPVSDSRGRDHPVANPARRLPAIDAPHDAVVAVLDVTPDGFRHSHGLTSTRPVRLKTRIDVPQQAGTLLLAAQLPRPMLAEPHFVQPVKCGNCRNENGPRQKGGGSRPV